jgi:hypothetical protein
MSQALSQQNEPCLTCNAVDCKRWQMLSGQWVCDECWLDVAMDIQQHHFRIAESNLTRTGCVSVPVAKVAGGRQKPITQRNWRIPLSKLTRKALDTLVQPGYNSVCLLCAHIFYGAAMSSCSRCGGLCQLRTDHDLQLQQRRAIPMIEAEK